MPGDGRPTRPSNQAALDNQKNPVVRDEVAAKTLSWDG